MILDKAAQLLREHANELQQTNTVPGDPSDWCGDLDAQAKYLELIEVANALDSLKAPTSEQVWDAAGAFLDCSSGPFTDKMRAALNAAVAAGLPLVPGAPVKASPAAIAAFTEYHQQKDSGL